MSFCEDFDVHGDGDTPDQPTGSDATGTVEVTLDESGRVSGLRISARWKDRIEPGAFADALTEAVDEATSERFSRDDGHPAAGAVVENEGDPVARAESLLGGLTAEQSMDAASRLADVLDSALEELEPRLQALDAFSSSFYGSDERNHVTVGVTGSGVLTSIRIDEDWLESAALTTVVVTVEEAFREAYAQAESETAGPRTARPSGAAALLLDEDQLRRHVRQGV